MRMFRREAIPSITEGTLVGNVSMFAFAKASVAL